MKKINNSKLFVKISDLNKIIFKTIHTLVLPFFKTLAMDSLAQQSVGGDPMTYRQEEPDEAQIGPENMTAGNLEEEPEDPATVMQNWIAQSQIWNERILHSIKFQQESFRKGVKIFQDKMDFFDQQSSALASDALMIRQNADQNETVIERNETLQQEIVSLKEALQERENALIAANALNATQKKECEDKGKELELKQKDCENKEGVVKEQKEELTELQRKLEKSQNDLMQEKKLSDDMKARLEKSENDSIGLKTELDDVKEKLQQHVSREKGVIAQQKEKECMKEIMVRFTKEFAFLNQELKRSKDIVKRKIIEVKNVEENNRQLKVQVHGFESAHEAFMMATKSISKSKDSI